MGESVPDLMVNWKYFGIVIEIYRWKRHVWKNNMTVVSNLYTNSKNIKLKVTLSYVYWIISGTNKPISLNFLHTFGGYFWRIKNGVRGLWDFFLNSSSLQSSRYFSKPELVTQKKLNIKTKVNTTFCLRGLKAYNATETP